MKSLQGRFGYELLIAVAAMLGLMGLVLFVAGFIPAATADIDAREPARLSIGPRAGGRSAALERSYRVALGAGGWEAMAAVGDEAVRMGDAASSALARRAYVSVLSRALRAGSVEGVLRAADGFTTLGEKGWAEHCIAVAQELAAR